MNVETNTCPPLDSASIQPDSLAIDLMTAVMRTSRRLRGEATGVTSGQYTVLAHVRGGPRTLRELADREHVQAPSMTRIVNALTEHGLVSRSPHPDDGRQVQVLITPAGETAFVEIRSQRAAGLARRVAGLSEEDRLALSRAAHIMQELSAR